MTTKRTWRGAEGRLAPLAAAAALLLACAACGAGESEPRAPVPGAGTAGARTAERLAARTPARPQVVVLGDSIAAGLGLPRQESFPARLQEKIDAAGLRYEVVNAGVSGDTSAGGLRRLDWSLDGDVRVLILELGANDGLRGLSADEMARNLSAIIERARARDVEVLLCGMEAPPNFGQAYTRAFRDAYAAVARRHGVPFIPFVLDGVAGLPEMNQSDGIHPNAAGARKVADTVWSRLQPMLQVDRQS